MKTLITAALILVVATPWVASEEDDPTSLSYISYLERYATIQPASADESIEAMTNMPLVIGDRVDTAREARMEIVLADGSILWLDQYTTVSLDAVAFSRDVGGDRTVLYLVDGRIMLQVPDHVLTPEPLRIDSAGATVYLNQPGVYRIEVQRSGGLRVEVWDGLAEAATVAGGILVQPSTAADVRDGKVAGVEPYLTWGDDFARWVDQRRETYESESSAYVDHRYAREANILDSYGSWVYVDATQEWAWQPAVDTDWRPYTAGRWYWTPTGWSWLSYEPWGWLPYHYGSWYHTAGYGWVWGWGSVWSPAWVSWCWWPGYVSWCPWGYYNSWYRGHYPYWGWYHDPPGHRPPRGGVVPPRGVAQPSDSGRRLTPEPRLRAGADATGGSRRVAPGDGGKAVGSGRRAGADFTGRVRVAEMDRAGWNVVSAGDFASENLSRVVQPGSRAMPDHGDTVGVVVTGPLATRASSQRGLAVEIERSFTDVGARTDRDITRVMARDPNLGREDIDRLVQPSSLADLGRSSAQTVISRDRPASAGVTPGTGTARPELGTAGRSPLAPSSQAGLPRVRTAPTNIYRPGRGPGAGSARTPVDPGAVSPNLGGSPLVRSPGSTAGGRGLPSSRDASPPAGTRAPQTLPRTRSSSSLPSTRSSSSPLMRQPVTPRVGVGRPSSSSSPSRPVIVPRTSPTRPSRSMGSGSTTRRPPSVRSAPSGRSSSPSVRAPSRSSSGSSGVRSSGSSRSSAGSSSASRSSSSSGSKKKR